MSETKLISTPCSVDPIMEKLSDKVRRGEPVHPMEALAVIEYQELMKSENTKEEKAGNDSCAPICSASDTPETNIALLESALNQEHGQYVTAGFIDHARRMEKERDEARKIAKAHRDDMYFDKGNIAPLPWESSTPNTPAEPVEPPSEENMR